MPVGMTLVWAIVALLVGCLVFAALRWRKKAKVTLELVKKFGADRMRWVVEALFDDLLDWNDWFLRKRLKPPLNMVALGTFNDQNGQAGNMQDARYESGLDNSPMQVEPPPALARYIATKGSIAINGVSLTVNEVVGQTCRINVVPYTIEETLLGSLYSGSSVNIEVDVIARYLERLLSGQGDTGTGTLTFERLAELGYKRH